MYAVRPVKVILNTPTDSIHANIRSCLERRLPELKLKRKPMVGRVSIVAAGPSLADTYQGVIGSTIIACNGAAKYLADRGIRADYCTIADARPNIVELVKDPVDTTYLIASMVDPGVFDALKDSAVKVWHCFQSQGEDQIFIEYAKKTKRKYGMVGGGSTVGLRSIFIAYLMGFRDIHLFGFDSCHQKGQHHAYEQELNDDDTAGLVPIICGDRFFRCAPWMVSQANEFQTTVRTLSDARISVHGDGLISEIVRQQKAA